MSDALNFNGEDLVAVLHSLKIELGDLSTNVIKAWFDTDCPDTRDLLNWMCLSLTSNNILTAQEQNEYNSLEKSTNIAPQVEDIELEYPSLFDVDDNCEDINFLEEELDILLYEERNLDHLLQINSNLNNNLCKEMSELNKELIGANVNLAKSEQQLVTTAEILDEQHEEIYSEVQKWGATLYNFEYEEAPQYITNLDLTTFKESLENMSQNVINFLTGYCHNLSDFSWQCKNSNDTLSTSDPLTNTLEIIRNRIFCSRQNYTLAKAEEESLKTILNFLETYNSNYNMTTSNSLHLEMALNAKEEQANLMMSVLSNVNVKLTHSIVSEPKMRFAHMELDILKKKLNTISDIKSKVNQLVCTGLLLNMFYMQEKIDIDRLAKFFHRVIAYINNDIKNALMKNSLMKDVEEEFDAYASKSLKEKSEFFKNISELFTNDNNSLDHTFAEVKNINEKIQDLERRLYVNEVALQKKTENELKNNKKILQEFLQSGPTCRMVIVPSDIQNIMGEVRKILENQSLAIKRLPQITSKTTKQLASNKWLMTYRHLWIHFFTDPAKIDRALQDIEEEHNKLQKKCFFE